MKIQIDLAEATRLTRRGKLSEAMAVLRGEGVRPAPEATSSDQPYIEMTQSDAGDWRAGFGEHTAQAPHSSPYPSKPRLDLSTLVGRFRFQADAVPGKANIEPLPSGASFASFSFGVGASHRNYKLYVPSTLGAQPAPLIVMLHGCTQSPDDFAAGTGMNSLAERHGFFVIYPEQSQDANMNRCWNWFKTSDQQKGEGEPAIVVGMVAQVVSDFGVDPQKVFVAGLSAGGAMAAILGVRYPDVFAAVGIHSGLAVGAAHDMPSAFATMNQGASPTMLATGLHCVPTIIFHGDADRTVNVKNAEQLVAQASNRRTLTAACTSGQTRGGRGYTRRVYSDRGHSVGLEYWLVHGAGHAWSGGHRSGSYTDPRGPDASQAMVDFFLAAKPSR